MIDAQARGDRCVRRCIQRLVRAQRPRGRAAAI